MTFEILSNPSPRGKYDRMIVRETGRPDMTFGTPGQVNQYINQRNKVMAKEAAEAAKAEEAKRLRLAHPVGAAIEALRADTMVRVGKEFDEYVAKVAKVIVSNGHNLDTIAPRPNSRTDNRIEYKRKAALRQSYTSLCAIRPDHRLSMPTMIDLDAGRVADRREQELQAASAQYDAFAAKLIRKIGDCTSAVLNGTHVWGYSVLTVTKADGSIECWKTQQIVNCSVLGNLFNQWPSRRMK